MKQKKAASPHRAARDVHPAAQTALPLSSCMPNRLKRAYVRLSAPATNARKSNSIIRIRKQPDTRTVPNGNEAIAADLSRFTAILPL
jgi:hypothetical protein